MLTTLLEMVTECAERGLPCPTNTEIADRLGYMSHAPAAALLQRLEDRGVIIVERFACTRIVTIVETGKATAGDPGSDHWRYRKVPAPAKRKTKAAPANPAPVPPPARQEPIRVSREPCFYCNTRADIGCKHTRRPKPGMSFPSVHR